MKLSANFYLRLMRCVGRLPFPVLFFLSDITCLVMAYLIRYRRKVIDTNLLLVFPEKTKRERNKIRRKYYRHLGDFFIETACCAGISYEKLLRRYKFTNPELLNKYFEEGRHLLLVSAHYGNWEWGFYLPQFIEHKLLTIYKRIDTPVFDQVMLDIRSRFGAIMIEMNKTLRSTVTYAKESKVALYLMADQSPAGAENWYFTDFLGVNGTPIFLGPERIAKSLNAVFVYVNIRKVKRGHYEVDFVTLNENAKKTEEYELTHLYLDYLEKQVRCQPEFWMWSHRRFKRRRENIGSSSREK